MKNNDRRARLIAFYLPQFHPIPENDEWWGKGFTEWTNVAKAKPLFKGHYQPRLPADLGFYDLRIPEVREAQAELARNAGIEGFCYYHYWFAGRRLLERPFNEVLASGKPDFSFCLCWANQTWSGIWHGAPNRILVEQTYPGADDNRSHFMEVLKAFHDSRYLRVGGRPIFVIFRPTDIPNVFGFIKQWQSLAVENGLPGIHFVAHLSSFDADWDFTSNGFDSCVLVNPKAVFSMAGKKLLYEANGDAREVLGNLLWRQYRKARNQFKNVRLYKNARRYMLSASGEQRGVYPCVTPNWDNTPRSGKQGYVLHDSTPALFREHLQDAVRLVEPRPPDQRLVFIKSWNEWAEGNYLEPDQKYGHEYLTVVREEMLPANQAKSEPQVQ